MKLTILLLGIFAICVVNGEEPGLAEATTNENQNATAKVDTEPDDKIQSRILDPDYHQAQETGLDADPGVEQRRFYSKEKGETIAEVHKSTKSGGTLSFGTKSSSDVYFNPVKSGGGGSHSWKHGSRRKTRNHHSYKGHGSSGSNSHGSSSSSSSSESSDSRGSSGSDNSNGRYEHKNKKGHGKGGSCKGGK